MGSAEVLDKRKAALAGALRQLMIRMPYSKITVDQLIEEVGISRKTFYRTFSSKDACLEALMDQFILEQHSSVTLTLTHPVDLVAAYSAHLMFWKKHKAFVDALLRNKLFPLFLKRSIIHIQNEEHHLYRILQTTNMECDEDVLLFFNAGNTVMIIKWLYDDCKTPVEEMAHKLVRLNHTQLLHNNDS